MGSPTELPPFLLSAMHHNRSIPSAVVIPVLAYRDATEAAAWLRAAFGFEERLRIANHRVQLSVDGAAVVVTEGAPSGQADSAHSVMVRVEDVDRHHAQAVQHGARVVRPPEDHPYGERQYTAVDPG